MTNKATKVGSAQGAESVLALTTLAGPLAGHMPTALLPGWCSPALGSGTVGTLASFPPDTNCPLTCFCAWLTTLCPAHCLLQKAFLGGSSSASSPGSHPCPTVLCVPFLSAHCLLSCFLGFIVCILRQGLIL